ncbi:MAG: Fic family protein [Alphaproteobacteria bacterium]|nr:Fic family protein [Alphaproteobacteria bacterium]
MINLKNIHITSEMLNIIAEVDEFKGAWNTLKQQPNKYKHLKKIATIESIGSSNRIEGNTLTDKQVETVLANIKRQSFVTRDEQEVAGYAELMENIFENYEFIPFNENYIKQLHKILLSFSDKDERHRGEYKTISNSVAAFDTKGNEIGIIFETATPFETPNLMRELVQEIKEHLEDRIFHPIIIIGLFVVHFLAIHPFQDGNGRMSRALTTLLLLKNGYLYVPYSSMESIIEENKGAYYQALRNSQKTFKTDNVNYDYWLYFFLRTVRKQVRRLKEKMEQISAGLTMAESRVMELFNDKKQWITKDMAKMLNMNIATVKKIVGKLVKNNYLIKNGTTRGAWYERR